MITDSLCCLVPVRRATIGEVGVALAPRCREGLMLQVSCDDIPLHAKLLCQERPRRKHVLLRDALSVPQAVAGPRSSRRAVCTQHHKQAMFRRSLCDEAQHAAVAHTDELGVEPAIEIAGVDADVVQHSGVVERDAHRVEACLRREEGEEIIKRSLLESVEKRGLRLRSCPRHALEHERRPFHGAEVEFATTREQRQWQLPWKAFFTPRTLQEHAAVAAGSIEAA
mmetsp:Transcript_15035/g.34466  ORF Transcript_15035/g.34466 Transcript_15035/m.34466 type:complete len:225 (-) Transcript_15035:138-812(-)